uniref:Uncharacterized protein n=1 Tax=Rhizophora mucronata TaxID=61149 RepID=A0A2P2Q1R0_RHIMU
MVYILKTGGTNHVPWP